TGTFLGGLALALAALAGDEAKKADQPVNAIEGPGTIDFKVGDRLVTRYHYGKEVAKPYFWPVNDPDGKPLTRAWPMVKDVAGEATDHVHQKSVWFCHGDVIPEGIEIKQKVKGVEGIDFWSEGAGHGVIVCTGIQSGGRAPGRATVQTAN